MVTIKNVQFDNLKNFDDALKTMQPNVSKLRGRRYVFIQDKQRYYFRMNDLVKGLKSFEKNVEKDAFNKSLLKLIKLNERGEKEYDQSNCFTKFMTRVKRFFGKKEYKAIIDSLKERTEFKTFQEKHQKEKEIKKSASSVSSEKDKKQMQKDDHNKNQETNQKQEINNSVNQEKDQIKKLGNGKKERLKQIVKEKKKLQKQPEKVEVTKSDNGQLSPKQVDEIRAMMQKIVDILLSALDEETSKNKELTKEFFLQPILGKVNDRGYEELKAELKAKLNQIAQSVTSENWEDCGIIFFAAFNDPLAKLRIAGKNLAEENKQELFNVAKQLDDHLFKLSMAKMKR